MIYIVEDDANIRELVSYALSTSGMETEGFDMPSAFWNAINVQLPDLIILDIMLPEEDGLSILRRLKENNKTKNIPVIMLTAKGTEIDKVKGFDYGADDYIAKPFGVMELVARVKPRLRNVKKENTCREYKIGKLFVSPSKHIVKVDGATVSLTLKEFEILCMLLKNMDIVLTRDQLLNDIWGYSFDGESRTVDVHIRTLRQKLGEAGDVIETVRGIGYKISEEKDE